MPGLVKVGKVLRAQVAGVALIGLVVLCVASWCALSIAVGDPPFSEQEDGLVQGSNTGENSQPEIARVALKQAVVEIVGYEKKPIRGATVSSAGVSHVSDEAGRVVLLLGSGPKTIDVSCKNYMPASGVDLLADITTVRLRPSLTVDIVAVDADSKPVPNARFWVRPYRKSGASLAMEDGSPSAVTDDEGKATIGPFEFPEGGPLFFQGLHEDLAYCYQAQDGGQAVVFREAGHHTLVARFLMPRVIAVDLPQAEVVTWKTQILGNSLRSTDNEEASWTCNRISDRIRKKFPNAVVTTVLPEYPPTGSLVVEPRFTLWIVGRQPFTVSCPAVPAGDFVAPLKIDPMGGMPHDGFGSIRAVVTDADGKPLASSKFRWIGDLTADWQGDRNLVVKPGGVDVDGWMTLPTGTWRVDFYDQVLNTLAKQQPSSTVVLSKGGSAEARVVFRQRMVVCRIEVSFDESDPRPTAGVVRLQNAQLGLDIPFLRNVVLKPMEFQLPEGENTVVVEARTTATGPWLHGRTAVTVRADGPSPMPLIAVRLSPRR